MSKLYVTEFANSIRLAGNDNVNAVSVPVNVDQTPVTYTTSTQSAAFASNTSMIRLHTDGICSVAFGTNPTATANNFRMNANTTEYFAVPTGAAYKVAAITNT